MITLGLRETDNINQISLILVYSDAINYLILSNIQRLLRTGVSNSNWLERRIGVVYEPSGCMHRCTRVENLGEGIPDVFWQNPKGGSRLSEKIAWGGGGPPISGFIAFLLTSVLKFAWGGTIFTLPPPPTSPPPLMCIYGCIKPKKGFSGPHKF